MGYGRALLQKDTRREEASLQKKAKKKSLWGSIGRTVGGLGVMALTGGAVNPVTLGLLTGGASFLGGAIGAKGAEKFGKDKGKLTGGKFFKSDRESLQTELGAFGTQNLMSSLKSGIQAGLGQAAKLQKAKLFGPEGAGEAAKFGKLDFQDSFVGKSKLAQNIRSAKYFKDQGLSEFVYPNLQVGTESGKKIIAMDRTDPNLAINKRLGMGTGEKVSYLDRVNKTALPKDIIPEVTAKGGRLSQSERGVYDTINKMTDEGYSVGTNRALPSEFGRGYIGDKGQIVRDPGRPDVPFTPEVEDEFFTGNNYPMADKDFGGFSEFDEASWRQGRARLNESKYGSGTDYITGGLSSEPTEMIEGEWAEDFYKNKKWSNRGPNFDESENIIQPFSNTNRSLFQDYNNIKTEDWSKTAKGY